MAVLLKYDSCLFEEALDAGFEDFIDCHNKRQEQDKEKQAWDEEQHANKEEKEAAGEEYVFEEKEQEIINEKQYQYRES